MYKDSNHIDPLQIFKDIFYEELYYKLSEIDYKNKEETLSMFYYLRLFRDYHDNFFDLYQLTKRWY